MNHVQIVLSTVMWETYFIPLASERRPLGAWGGGGGGLPVTGIPRSATSYSYECIPRIFTRVQSRMHIWYGIPPWGCNVLRRFSKDTHPNDWPVPRSKWLGKINSSRKIEASAAFRKLVFFFTVYLQICLSASLDDFLENSGKALINSKRLKLPECPNR